MSIPASNTPNERGEIPEGNFTPVIEIFGDDKADLKNFLGLVDDDLLDITKELKLVAGDKSLDRYRAIRHNTLTSVRLFELHTLNRLLDDGLALVRSGKFEEAETQIQLTIREIERFRSLLVTRR